MIEIPLTQEQFSIIDDEDAYIAELKWHAQFNPSYGGGGAFMAVRKAPNLAGKWVALYMHRVIMSRISGYELVRQEQVDHINGNTLDNRRNNLRIASNVENGCNRRRQSNNKSGYKGVCWNKKVSKWQTNIALEGKSIHLGLFEDLIDAAKAYDKAAKELHGEFAFLNFPDSV